MNTNLTNQLHYYRNHHGLTQEELGQAVGVTRQTIIAIEKGNYSPSVILALKLAQHLSVTIEQLFQLEGDSS